MKPSDFTPHKRIAHEYYDSIARLLYRELNLTERATPAEVLHAFANLARSPEILLNLGSRLASRMVTQVRVQNARSWREAARQASRGREIYLALQKEMNTGVGVTVRGIVTENAKLISSIPAKVRTELNHEILRMEQEGLRPEEISRFLRRRIPKITKARAALIARTETGKAATALTRARSESLGINWYQWATSEDQRVRSSHRIMDKVLVNWNDPPSPERLAHEPSRLGVYHAGNAPNCRCDSYPIVSLDQISWPARVFFNGSIKRMSRRQFSEISGSQIAA